MNRATVEVEDTEAGASRILSDQETDPLDGLFTPGPGPHASVSLTVGTQVDFGRLVIRATVSYQCDQKTNIIDIAGEKAFSKAVELAHDGLDELLKAKAP